jgi:hypothetical protein
VTGRSVDGLLANPVLSRPAVELNQSICNAINFWKLHDVSNGGLSEAKFRVNDAKSIVLR